MTGRDLIIYILANGLEDEPVIKNDSIIGFDTEAKFAEKHNLGVATIRAMEDLGTLSYVRIGYLRFIPSNALSLIPTEKSGNNA